MKDKEKTEEQALSKPMQVRKKITVSNTSIREFENAEHEVLKSEEMYAALVKISPDAVTITDLKGSIIEVSERTLELHGYQSDDEMLGRSAFELIADEDHKRAAANLKRTLEQGTVKNEKYSMLRKDGTRFLAELNVALIKDVYGKPKAFIAIVRDITKREKAEQKLMESEKRFWRFLSMISDGIYRYDPKNKQYDFISPSIEMLTGYTLAEIKEYPSIIIKKVIHPEDEKRVFSEFENHLKKGPDMDRFYTEYRIIRKAGQLIWVSDSRNIEFTPQGEIYRINGVIRDITDCKKVEESLRESEQRQRILSEATFTGICIHENNKITDANEIFAKTWGYKISEVIGMNPLELVAPESYKTIWRNIKSGYDKPYKAMGLRKDGSTFPVEIRGKTISHQGRKIRVVALRDVSEQNKAGIAYRTLFENSLQGLAILEGHKLVFVNPSLAKMLGYTAEELISLSPDDWKTIVHPEDQTMVFSRFRDRLEGKPMPQHYEFRMIRKDGKVIWVGIFSSYIEYYGKPAIQAAFIDITERKKTEEKLKSVEQEKVLILNNMTEHVVYQDKEMKVVWANKAAGQSVGRAPEELLGHHCYEIWQGRSEPCPRCPIVETVKTGVPHQAEMTTADGRYWFISGHPVRNEKGIITGAVEVTLEITQRKKMERELKQSERDYRGLFESAHDAILILDPEGEIVLDVNQRACTIYGFDRSEFIGMSLERISKDVIRGRKHIKAALDKGLYHHFETCQYRKDGTEILLEINASVVEYKGKRTILSINRDITERKKMQEELLKAKKLESIGILAGGIAHDFNNILTGILGNISVAKAKVDSEDEIFRTLVKAEKASLRAKDLTQQLLTFSRGGAPIKETTSIGELIEDSANFVLRGSNVKCEFSIPDGLWPVEIDRGQINQVLNNIVINADQSMPDGGIIKVSAENISLGAKDVSPLKKGRYVKMTIKDQGIGIPKQNLQKIFDPYFTTKKKGDGLGLTTSYSIIKNHNGHIQVESELGTGSTLIIYLPASRKKITKKKFPKEKSLAGKGRILVMDDEDVVREVVGDLLAILGYDVEFAKNGNEVIQLYKEAKKTAKPFDAVVMDLTVPGGMGGKESIQKLLKIDPEVKAIVSSGYSNDPVMSDFKKYGFRGIVAKPFKMEELSQVLHQVLT